MQKVLFIFALLAIGCSTPQIKERRDPTVAHGVRNYSNQRISEPYWDRLKRQMRDQQNANIPANRIIPTRTLATLPNQDREVHVVTPEESQRAYRALEEKITKKKQ